MKWTFLAIIAALGVFVLSLPILALAKKPQEEEVPPAPEPDYVSGSDVIDHTRMPATYSPPAEPMVYAPVVAIPQTQVEAVKQDPTVYGPDSTGQPRGIRNNNPGNVRTTGDAWQGMTGTDDKGFIIFGHPPKIEPENGLRCLTAVLWNSYFKQGINTISAIIQKYAPSTDANDPDAYARTVANALGVTPTTPLDYKSSVYHLVLAIGNVENGKPLTYWYSLDQINRGVNAGLQKVGML